MDTDEEQGHPAPDGIPDDVPVDETPEEAAAALWRRRRSNRIHDMDRLDALYRVYLTAVVGTVVVLLLSSAIGDQDVSAAGLREVVSEGPAWLGLCAALAAAFGLRSGSRGGPLALEPAEVRLVLQAPLDRRTVLRHHAFKLLRFGAFVGAVAGAVAGQLAVRRLGGAPLGWVITGAVWGVVVTLLGMGLAMTAGGLRLTRPIATVVGGLLLAWAVADVTSDVWSPFRLFGSLALWPLDAQPVDVLAVVIAAAAVAVGLVVLGGLSMEAAERRTGLVAQLRFAVTVQDLRTVVLLRRQLAMDLPRNKPWISLRKQARWFPVWRRDLRGLLRFPFSRVLRLVLLGVVAGLSLRGVWRGTTPLLVPAGLALYLAALDAAEPLAQEADQLDRADSYPTDRGDLLVRHLAAAVAVMLLVGVVAWIAVLVTAPEAITLQIGAITLVPMALLGAAGAVASVVGGIPLPSSTAPLDTQILMPEMAGMKVVLRSGFPPLLAVLGTLPVVVAREAWLNGRSAPAAAATLGLVLLVPAGITGAWVRFREPAKAWWQASLEQSQSGGARRRDTP